eukprot:927531-Alexandrium_andersonii.AAC.1
MDQTAAATTPPLCCASVPAVGAEAPEASAPPLAGDAARVPSLPLEGAGAAEDDCTSAEEGMSGKPTLGPTPGHRGAP